MASYEINKIAVGSLVKSFPIVFALLGTLIGIFTFFIFPTELASNLGFGARILSWLIFIVLYTAIMSIGLVVVAALFNFVAGKLGKGIIVNLEQSSEE